jgi:hypothetical protein
MEPLLRMWDPDKWRDTVNAQGFECSFEYSSDKRYQIHCSATIYRRHVWAELVREGDYIYGFVLKKNTLSWKKVEEAEILDYFQGPLLPDFAKRNDIPPQVTIEYGQESLFTEQEKENE